MLPELQELIEQIRKQAEEVKQAPCHDDPNLHVWVEEANSALNKIYAIAERILGQ